MKNRIVVVILLIAVVVIWGTLTYKIYNHFAGNDSKPAYTAVRPVYKSKLPKKDIHIIHSYSRDPFLSILADTAQPVIPAADPPKLITIPKKPVILPEYMGFFEDGKKKTAIIKNERKTTFVHEGDKWQNITIVHITFDSLIVAHDGKKQTIKLKKKR